MKEKAAIAYAAEYLTSQGISFCEPVSVVAIASDSVEVVFTVPEALSPEVAVIDPPDVRVLVHSSGSTKLVEQM